MPSIYICTCTFW